MNKDQNSLSPEDPRLTAYALGELEGAELAEIEAAVAADPALRAAVDEIRATAGHLASALAEEAADAGAHATAGSATAYSTGEKPGRVIRFPLYYYVIGSMAAACFAFLVVMDDPRLTRVSEGTAVQGAPGRALEIPLASSPGADARAQDAAVKATEAPPANDNAVNVYTTGNPSDPVPSKVVSGPVVQQSVPAAPSPVAPVEQQQERNFMQQSTSATPPPAASAAAAPAGGAAARGGGGGGRGAAGRAGGGGGGGRGGAPAAGGAQATGEVVRMTPFEIREESKQKSEPQSYSVINREFIDALSINDMAEAAAWATGQTFTATDNGGDGFGRPSQYYSRSNAGETAPGSEVYGVRRDNRFLPVEGAFRLSTFSIDVDTAGYSNVRRFLQGGALPPRDAVRIEELINYFPYGYAGPANNTPFASHIEVASAPWNPAHRLVKVGIKGREVSTAARQRASLVFLLDVSGSMAADNKLPLVKESMRMLLERLRPDDRVAIVVYAGASGLALGSTPVSRSGEILSAIERLQPGGSTNGAMGIELAYEVARANFVEGGVNRVILCTDGDFNVGVTNRDDLVRLVEDKARSNVFLTVLGFGMGNLKDATLELLADRGNGQYGYIDTRREAEKMLVEQVSGTLVTIAKDVKLQVEFNPEQVVAYRLIGYENRLLRAEDFNNDRVDAGDIGAGHTVTALYEIIPVSAAAAVPGDGQDGRPVIDELRYQRTGGSGAAVTARGRGGRAAADPLSMEMLTVKVRYKEPTGDTSRLLEFPLTDRGARFENATADFRFAAAVAGFGMALRDDDRANQRLLLANVARWAEGAMDARSGRDPGGYRSEFLELVAQARRMVQ